MEKALVVALDLGNDAEFYYDLEENETIATGDTIEQAMEEYEESLSKMMR